MKTHRSGGWRLVVLACVFALAGGLSAQIEQFNNAQLPTGWTIRTTPGCGNLWAVDNSGTTMPFGVATPITPYVSAPFSLNFNNGTNVDSGLLNDSGVVTSVYDITFAPNPQLWFQRLMHRFYFSNTTSFNLFEVRVWDAAQTTVVATFPLTCTSSYLCDWTLVGLPLDRNWGQVRFEFRYYNTTPNLNGDLNSGGLFIDDVEVRNLLPPIFAITNNPTLTSVQVGAGVNEQFTALNGAPPYSNWRITAGALPAGVTLNQGTGALSGAPTVSGSYHFTVSVDDNTAPAPQTASKPFSLAVTRSSTFVYPVRTLPWFDDFSGDEGWVFTTNNPAPPSITILGPGPAPYTDVSNGGWERGFTTQSPPGSWPQDQRDPPQDHSPSADNMLMGVRVGDVWPTTAVVNDLYWSYTPELDVGGLQFIDISFWRWLNASTNHILSKVEIWNPVSTTWMPAWSAQNGVADNTWVFQLINIDFTASPPGGAGSRVRFGWGITSSSAMTGYGAGGFNIDDVMVIEKPQPGILKIKQAKIFSTNSPAVAPAVYVGNRYPMILEVENTSTVDIEVNSFQYDVYQMLGGNPIPHNVGNFVFTVAPSTATPWVVPPGASIFISNNPPGVELYHTDFDCTAVAGASGTTVFLHVVLHGKEAQAAVGQPRARSVIADSATTRSGNSKFTPSQTPQVSITDPTVLPAANLGQPYTYRFTAANGTPPYLNWAMTAAPAWLSFNSATQTINGTPPAQQQYQLTIEVDDSQLPTAGHASKNFTIDVLNLGPQPVQITTSSQLPNATEQQPYAPLAFNAIGGVPPYSWTLLGGTLPVGMTFTPSTGTLAGTPGAATTGAYAVQIRTRDSSVPALEVTRTFYLSVLPENQVVAITTPSTGPGSPPRGLETDPYNNGVPFVFAASGGFVSGQNSYKWTIISGTWPAGLVLNTSTGAVSGVPTLQGNYSFDLRVADGAFPPKTAQASFTIVIDPLVAVPMFISSGLLPQCDEGNIFATQLSATYGVAPLTWRVKAGSALPAGLILDSAGGNIAGVATPGQATTPSQDFVFTIEVLDSTVPRQLAEKTFTLHVIAFVNGALTVTTPAFLPEAGVEHAYSVFLKATGGTSFDPLNPYQWLVNPTSSLPAGLTLELNGELHGIPPLLSDGTYTFLIDVLDGAGANSTRQFTLQVNDHEKPPEKPSIEIEAGRKRVQVVPFWEACSVGVGAGQSGMVVLAALTAFAGLRRRRNG